EPYDGKLSRTVLRGVGGSDAPRLPDLLSAKNDNLQTLGRKYIEKEKEIKTISGINNSSSTK
ncbi:hypothetical protein, partial [Bacillus cereus group sp. Bce037]|uniref:hypothetical protein n=1 Tax=Bacillus cereus group sp. Bce037 TaxID=3445232 RepID=UPI003F20D8C4